MSSLDHNKTRNDLHQSLQLSIPRCDWRIPSTPRPLAGRRDDSQRFRINNLQSQSSSWRTAHLRRSLRLRSRCGRCRYRRHWIGGWWRRRRGSSTGAVVMTVTAGNTREHLCGCQFSQFAFATCCRRGFWETSLHRDGWIWCCNGHGRRRISFLFGDTDIARAPFGCSSVVIVVASL